MKRRSPKDAEIKKMVAQGEAEIAAAVGFDLEEVPAEADLVLVESAHLKTVQADQ